MRRDRGFERYYRLETTAVYNTIKITIVVRAFRLLEGKIKKINKHKKKINDPAAILCARAFVSITGWRVAINNNNNNNIITTMTVMTATMMHDDDVLQNVVLSGRDGVRRVTYNGRRRKAGGAQRVWHIVVVKRISFEFFLVL